MLKYNDLIILFWISLKEEKTTQNYSPKLELKYWKKLQKRSQNKNSYFLSNQPFIFLLLFFWQQNSFLETQFKGICYVNLLISLVLPLLIYSILPQWMFVFENPIN